MNNSEVLTLRKQIIENEFKRMNDMQLKAVFKTKGPLLILAGAGSGKTTVVVNRIANLVKYGDAYNSEWLERTPDENDIENMKRYLAGDNTVYDSISDLLSVNAVKPWQILAITFTNKAANVNPGNVIGIYATKYDAKIPRANNVAVAASRINGVVVKKGEDFSFNATILPRTTANGYVNAPIFINKKHGMGIGGGVCQVSSTLYAAMLSAGLPATERHPHSLKVPYIPEGMDATIAGNTLDLRFTNTFDYAIVIGAVADNGTLTVSISRY